MKRNRCTHAAESIAQEDPVQCTAVSSTGSRGKSTRISSGSSRIMRRRKGRGGDSVPTIRAPAKMLLRQQFGASVWSLVKRLTILFLPLVVLVLLQLPFVWGVTEQEQDEDGWWKPAPGVNWDWRLSGTAKVSAGVEVFDIDLFDMEMADIETLQDAGIVVICYFSAGTYEAWREDEGSFPRSALGLEVSYSQDEWWLNINDEDILPVMTNRLDLAVEKGCDGVDPDAVQTFSYPEEVTGWAITADEQLTYNKWIADQAHERNLSVGLKNDRAQAEELEPWFDWAVVTDCYIEDNCTDFMPFTIAGKAVLDAEFSVSDLALCNATEFIFVDFIVKGYDLGEARCSCGFPDTNFECETLLSEVDPTEAPSDLDSSSAAVEEGLPSGGGGGDEDGDIPTWIIVSAVAVVVLVGMLSCGAVVWRRRALERKSGAGVDDFVS